MNDLAVRVLTGVVLLFVWEALVTWLAPSYVARPSGVIRAIPRVLQAMPHSPIAVSKNATPCAAVIRAARAR